MKNKKRPEFIPRASETIGRDIMAIHRAASERRRAVKFQFYWFSLLEAADRWKHNKGIASGIFDGENRVCYTSVTFWEKSPPNYPDYKLVGKAKINADINCVRGIDETAFNAGHFEREPPPGKKHFRKTDPMDAVASTPSDGKFIEVNGEIFEDD